VSSNGTFPKKAREICGKHSKSGTPRTAFNLEELESDLTLFSGNAGTKISCTVSAFKIALGTGRPAV
jgi:hypothetical protein